MRVLVIEPEDRATHASLLDAMHRHRHRLFVDVLGWAALRAVDGRERDTYDAAATYLIACDGAGVLRGSLRLLPTLGPHMLADTFAAFVEGPAPRGATLMEWTRHAPGDPAWAPQINEQARLALHLGVLEFAALHGVTAFTALLDTQLIRRARAIGWDCTPLGPPLAYGEGEAIAVLNPVHAGHLERLREKSGIAAPVLVAPTQVAA